MRRPDIVGDYGRAWQVPLDIQRSWLSEHVIQMPKGMLDYRLAAWYVNGLAYHPTHSWWLFALDRLSKPYDERDEPRMGVKLYREAQFEIVGWTLAWKPDVNGRSLYETVGEYDLWHQSHGITHEQAQAVLAFHVEAICGGRTDPRRGWIDQNREALNNVVSAYHEGKFGGPVRPGLEVDPYTKRLTGRERQA